MRRFVAMASLICLAAFASVIVGSGAGAVVPGSNGRILFARAICTSDTRPCWEIVAADPDDSHETLLAGPYPRSVWDDHFIANWSPDGRQVIFMADLGSGQSIWEVNANGTGLHPLFTAPPGTGLDDGPSFTPDGRYIIFTRCCPQSSGYGLWRINADGTGLRIVTTEAVGPNVDGPSDNLPQVSPDGRTIAFHRCFAAAPCVLATVNIAGGGLRQLTDPSLNAGIPNWSPDGSRIVFQAQGLGTIWAISPDGSGLTQLDTFETAKSFSVNPSYSPDGSKIIFGHGPSTGSRDLFTMNPDGTGVTQITRTPGEERFPQWAAV